MKLRRQSIRADFAAAQATGCRTLGFACKRGELTSDDLLEAARGLTYLGFAAICIVVAHAEISVVFSGLHGQQTICTNTAMPITKPRDDFAC